MLPFCVCPPATAMTAIPAIECGEDFGQIQRFFFQRKQAAAPLTTTTGLLKANWDALFDATDETKIVLSPFFENFVVPGVTAIKEGGDDNSTRDGVAIVVGESTPNPTGRFRSIPSATFELLQKLNCEPRLTAFWINEYDEIIFYSATGTSMEGIPMTEWYVGDKSVNGKNTSDFNEFTFALRPGWSKKLKKIKPTDFSPLGYLGS